jgi:hypothetical protein
MVQQRECLFARFHRQIFIAALAMTRLHANIGGNNCEWTRVAGILASPSDFLNEEDWPIN